MAERKSASEKASEAYRAEQEFHKTAQRNAIGGYIGCDGPDCWALIQEISRANTGQKIQGV